ncbi:MAG: hypothetical protein AB1698_18105 [Pseudomonadota bacterium]
MNWVPWHTPASPLEQKLDVLRGEIGRLARPLADYRPSGGPVSPQAARRFAHQVSDRVTDAATDGGRIAGTALIEGAAAAWSGGRTAARRLDAAARDTQEMVARYPAATAIAVVGVGLTLAYVLSLAVRKPRRRKFASSGGNVRRPPAKASREFGRTARPSRQDG